LPPSLKTRRRIVTSFLVVILAVVALATRVGFIMVGRGPDLARQGRAARMRAIPVGAPRGRILDDRGRVLASDTTVYSIFAVPAQVRDPVRTADLLAPILDLPPDRLAARLRLRQAIVWLKRKVPRATEEAVSALHLPGVDLSPETRRVYPYGPLAAQVLGFAGIDNQGLDGVELTYDKLLRGRAGAVEVEMDARNNRIPRAQVTFRPPVPGDTLRLTLDAGLQRIAARGVRQAMADTGATSAWVVIMDVHTGGILALAVEPTYDPNDYAKAPPQVRRDPVVSDDFPPGSTFKIVTAAAGLDTGTVTPATGFYDPGFTRVNGVRIRCWKAGGHGAVSFQQVVEGSCNVGFVELGLRLGTERFYQYLARFHLLGRTGVDLPGEAKSIVPPMAAVKPVDLATMAFGQTLALTPIQLLAAVAAVADGGVWHRPHVMEEVLDPEGNVVRRYDSAGERILSAQAARTLVGLLGGVVARGTGKNAKVKGYDLAGKTGTAQAVINGRYVEGKYVSSFVGFGPLPDPSLAILVGINQPVGPYYGGQIAAPVFARVMSAALAYLNVPPTVPLGAEVEVPDVGARPVAEAEQALRALGLTARVIGEGTTVESQFPPPGAQVTKGTQVVLFTAGVTQAIVPDLRGKTVPEAVSLLDRQALSLRLSGFGVIEAQSPPPGTRLAPGATVVAEARPHAKHPAGP
jgi:stage V sporulation protein D (sporulation-specific penicillin-binding protein)